MGCSSYHEVTLEDDRHRVKAYCEGDASGKLRMPMLFEEACYRTTEAYPDCAIFWAQRA
jgi:hypothetical protein